MASFLQIRCPWMEIAHRLPDLIETHQLRSHVDKMPLLSTQHLQGDRELQLAHLALSFVTMGYVWQEGEKGTVKVLPRNLAIPFAEISRTLGLPPILVHMDFVLVNWKKKDHNGPLEIENLDPVICLPGGESLRGFILVTFLVEKAAAPGIKAIAQAVNGMRQNDGKILEEALQEISSALKDMMAALKTMHDYVDPEIFYRVIRIFLSGWQDNPALSGGLIYEGVWEEPRAYSGGSAAQSTTLHAFDELLGIRHSRECTAFLHRMRDYMPPHHQAFIKEIQASPLLRCYVLASGKKELQSGYNRCVAALSDLRTCHIAIVTKYITMAAIHARAKPSNATPRMSPPSFLEKRGTGGSEVLSFLKSIRDTTREAMLDF
ncbi:indoleamine 2,3-dioxygenase 2-like isoform X2 [Hemicordylus capensis]|uniref:indoleamine 2,3-dioxygenase 2-like isoform X2 n=1 Tax=Hemicordylus capensis TaxID=884348 RepID=UPI0023024ED1|nr:indoleamine 2,3-dioxygenase 2-like isoform X2 [Hemicordylus capensis]